MNHHRRKKSKSKVRINNFGIPKHLLSKSHHQEHKAVCLLYKLHKYLIDQPDVVVDEGFRFNDVASLDRFKEYFWGADATESEWMSKSFGGFITQMKRCNFKISEEDLVWCNPLFRTDKPLIKEILQEKTIAKSRHKSSVIAASAGVIRPDDAGPSVPSDTVLQPQTLDAVLMSIAEEISHMQARSNTLIVAKSLNKAVKKNIRRQDDSLSLVKNNVDQLGRHFQLSTKATSQLVECMLCKGISRWAPHLSIQKAIIDVPAPSLGEPFDLTHLSSIFVGDTIAQILKFSKVMEVGIKSPVRDWGTKVGMLVEQLFDVFPRWKDVQNIYMQPLLVTNLKLQEWYRRAELRFLEEDEFRNRARKAVDFIKNGAEKYVEALEIIQGITQSDVYQLYTLLEFRIDESAWSSYEPYIHDMLASLEDGGLLTALSDDEVDREICIEGERLPLSLSGDQNYETLTDLASMRCYMLDEKADLLVYVRNGSLCQHYQFLFKVAELAEWIRVDETKVIHSKFCLVQGQIVTPEFFDHVKNKCESLLLRRGRAKAWTLDELKRTAASVGFGALKYTLLRNNNSEDYAFSFEEVFRDRGNSGMYVQLVHARISSIITESGEPIEHLKKNGTVLLLSVEEQTLASHLITFSQVVEEVCSTSDVSVMCDYLYEVCKMFERFYLACKAAGGSHDEICSRILLCEATAVVIRQCFSFFGIVPVYKLF